VRKELIMYTIEFKKNGEWTGVDIHPYFEPEPADTFAKQMMIINLDYEEYRIVRVDN
jgi:hypothetical protein